MKRKWVTFPWIVAEGPGTVLWLLLGLLLLAPAPAAAGNGSVWLPLLERLQEDGFADPSVRALYLEPEREFLPAIMGRKMNVLLNTRLEARKPGPPSEPKVLDRYTNPLLIAGGYAYLREHSSILKTAEKRYGVPGEVLVAIMLVETKLGVTIGRDKALDILSSMAVADDVKTIRPFLDAEPEGANLEWLKKRTAQKAEWAYMELTALLTYASQNNLDVAEMPGSPYGAIGLCQFIPTSALHYGVDGDDDGVVNLFTHEDALHSIGNYLKKNGWKPGLDKRGQLKVVYRYNHSESYALTILDVADRLRRTREMFGG